MNASILLKFNMVQKHLHIYRRVKVGKNDHTVYRCMEPNCSHFQQPELMEGKFAKCPRCGNPYVITERMIKDKVVNLHCDDCTIVRENDTGRITNA